jgi:oligoribonuclease
VAEAAAAMGALERGALDPLDLFDALDHQLRNPVAPRDVVVVGRIGVQQHDLEFVAIPGVDQTGGVGEPDAMLQRHAAAWQHEASVALGHGDCEAGGDQHPTATRDDGHVDPSQQVDPGVARGGIPRQRQFRIETNDLNSNHAIRHYGSRPADSRQLGCTRTSQLAPVAWRVVLVWMDLEMTGLDPTRDVIVEIATLITDDDLRIIAEGPDLVIHQPDEVLAIMDPYVVDMHTRSGLLNEIKESTLTLEEAGRLTLEFIKSHVPSERSVPLCGNSIGMDRRFLAAYLPEIENWLHYRSVDVSSVKELVKRWYPAAISKRPHKTGNHRALGDIRESVSELQYYRERAFIPATGTEDITTA